MWFLLVVVRLLFRFKNIVGDNFSVILNKDKIIFFFLLLDILMISEVELN